MDRLDLILKVSIVEHIDIKLTATGGYTDNDMTACGVALGIVQRIILKKFLANACAEDVTSLLGNIAELTLSRLNLANIETWHNKHLRFEDVQHILIV